MVESCPCLLWSALLGVIVAITVTTLVAVAVSVAVAIAAAVAKVFVPLLCVPLEKLLRSNHGQYMLGPVVGLH